MRYFSVPSYQDVARRWLRCPSQKFTTSSMPISTTWRKLLAHLSGRLAGFGSRLELPLSSSLLLSCSFCCSLIVLINNLNAWITRLCERNKNSDSDGGEREAEKWRLEWRDNLSVGAAGSKAPNTCSQRSRSESGECFRECWRLCTHTSPQSSLPLTTFSSSPLLVSTSVPPLFSIDLRSCIYICQSWTLSPFRESV